MKLAILTNNLAPYRLQVYSKLAESFDLTVFHGGLEANRKEWSDGPGAAEVTTKRSWGFQVPFSKKRNGQRIDSRFFHITPGFLIDMVRFRPNRVISSEMGLRSLLALTYGLLFGVPVWIWWGGTRHTERDLGFLRRLTRMLFRNVARQWISYGRSSTDYLVTLGVPRDRILQLQNCVDDRLFCPEGPRRLTRAPRPVVLHVGRLVAGKAIDSLLDAAATLQREGRVFSLVLVGSGPDEAKLKARAQVLKLANVHFDGAVRPDEMPAIYRGADLLVFPTLEDVWGLVINEALLCGVPVLCSKYAGCAEELVAPDAIFDPADQKSFAESLRRMISVLPETPDRSRIVSSDAVASLIATAVSRKVP